MTTDTAQLRCYCDDCGGPDDPCPVCQAADELDRLRAELSEERHAHNKTQFDLAEARKERRTPRTMIEHPPLGTRMRKTKGSSWQGRVVGYYSTSLTPHGVCIESEREPGSVQIYPITALEVLSDG